VVAARVSDLDPHLPRVAVEWDLASPGELWREFDASLYFVDISGFTALSEWLARRGRVGTEQLTEVPSHFQRLFAAVRPTSADREPPALRAEFTDRSVVLNRGDADQSVAPCSP